MKIFTMILRDEEGRQMAPRTRFVSIVLSFDYHIRIVNRFLTPELELRKRITNTRHWLDGAVVLKTAVIRHFQVVLYPADHVMMDA